MTDNILNFPVKAKPDPHDGIIKTSAKILQLLRAAEKAFGNPDDEDLIRSHIVATILYKLDEETVLRAVNLVNAYRAKKGELDDEEEGAA